METKFTKGPWVFEYPRKKRHYAKVSANDWSHFAKVVVRIEGIKEFSEEGLANAKLITAAPDLFKALIDITNLRYKSTNGEITVPVELVQQARKAIKKATE